jgi:hypothetical protein
MLGLIGAIGSVLSSVLSVEIKVLIAVAKALTVFGKELGLFDTEDPEMLGAKKIQAEEAGISPENYSDYQDYVKAVDSFELDEEKASQLSIEEKLENGVLLAATAIEDKYPEGNVSDIIRGVALNPEFYENDERFAALAELVEYNADKIAAIGRLLCGESFDDDDRLDTIDMLISAEKAINPDLSPEEAKAIVKELLA